MKKIFLLILITSSICFGQTKYDEYEKLISKGDYSRGIKDFGQAIISYYEALQILTPNSGTPFFKLAECAIKFKNTALADEWIRKGISQGGAQMQYLRKYEGFQNIQEMEFYRTIVLDYNSLRQEYFSTIKNIDIYLEIEGMIERDQFVRKLDNYIGDWTEEDLGKALGGLQESKKNNDAVVVKKHQKLPFSKPNKKYLKMTNELMKKVDSLNIKRLIEITKEYGWQERAWIILWHQRGTYGQDNYVWNYFKPLISKEISEGKVSRNFWAQFDQFRGFESGNVGILQIKKPK